jgi:hypothetical protein
MDLLNFGSKAVQRGAVFSSHLVLEFIQPASKGTGFHFGLLEILGTSSGILAGTIQRCERETHRPQTGVAPMLDKSSKI